MALGMVSNQTNNKKCSKDKIIISFILCISSSFLTLLLVFFFFPPLSQQAFHYLGYSIARPITVALFTSKTTGYPGSPAAFPFANAFVSPVSLLLLVQYGRVLDKYGPRGALSRSTLGCALTIFLAAIGIELSQQSETTLWGIPATKFISGPLFVFRESYVQLLTSQYWSFMASVLTPDQSAKWFAPIAGLTSISSVIGGTAVSILSKHLNLSGALACTAVALLISLFATGSAYSVAETNGFSPEQQQMKKEKRKKKTVEKILKSMKD